MLNVHACYGSSYDEVDNLAAHWCESGYTRIVFIARDNTRANTYVCCAMNQGPMYTPIKRYRRLTITAALASNQPLIEVKAVSDWRRN